MSIISKLREKRKLNKAKAVDESRRHNPITGKRNPGNKTNLGMSSAQPKLKNRRHKKIIDQGVESALRPVDPAKQVYNPKIQGGSYVDPPRTDILRITKAVGDYYKMSEKKKKRK